MLTIEMARKVLDVVDAGLCSGLGKPVLGEMCVEAAVCFALGMPHSDDPECVNPALRSFKIALNDKEWSSNSARAAGMRRLAVAQLGSTGMDSKAFCSRLAELTIRKILPIALRAIGTGAFELLAVRCENEGTAAAAATAANSAATAANSAAAAAATATYSAAAAATAAAYSAAAAAAAYSAAADSVRKRDEILTLSAELAIQVLRELNQPGIVLMDQLCP